MGTGGFEDALGGAGIGKGRNKPSKPKVSREKAKGELESFYRTYGMEDKVDSIDAALDKWKDKGYDKMMGALHRKYAEKIHDVEIAKSGKAEL